jgi:hypothetical protein
VIDIGRRVLHSGPDCFRDIRPEDSNSAYAAGANLPCGYCLYAVRARVGLWRVFYRGVLELANLFETNFIETRHLHRPNLLSAVIAAGHFC